MFDRSCLIFITYYCVDTDKVNDCAAQPVLGDAFGARCKLLQV
ncbi:MAG: hypothetical protein P4M14_05595 [Gammaproteobacteria bacterium]|nr:hypothetical protein [Gammaproteobacteria bacterium]